MLLQGKIKNGLGDAWFWVKKTEDAFLKRFGIQVFYGTLNVELEQDYKLEGNSIVMEPKEYGGQQNVYIKKCTINGYKAYIVRSEKNENGEGPHTCKLFEIVADVKLRDKLNLKDEDIVEIIL